MPSNDISITQRLWHKALLINSTENNLRSLHGVSLKWVNLRPTQIIKTWLCIGYIWRNSIDRAYLDCYIRGCVAPGTQNQKWEGVGKERKRSRRKREMEKGVKRVHITNSQIETPHTPIQPVHKFLRMNPSHTPMCFWKQVCNESWRCRVCMSQVSPALALAELYSVYHSDNWPALHFDFILSPHSNKIITVKTGII